MPIKVIIYGALGLAVSIPVALYLLRGGWYEGLGWDAARLCCIGVLILMLADGTLRGTKKGG